MCAHESADFIADAAILSRSWGMSRGSSSVDWSAAAERAAAQTITQRDRHAMQRSPVSMRTRRRRAPGDVKPPNIGRSEQLLQPQPTRPWPTAGPLIAMWSSSVRLRRHVASSSHRRRRWRMKCVSLHFAPSDHAAAAAAAACVIWRHPLSWSNGHLWVGMRDNESFKRLRN